MSWYFENGPESDVVVSTRIRFARNLSGYKFTSVADETELKRVLENFKGNGIVSGLQYIKLDELDELMRMSLVEKHIISRDMLKQKDAAVLLNTAEDVCVMLNKKTMSKFKSGKLYELPSATLNKLYVAITRAHRNCYFIEEYGI